MPLSDRVAWMHRRLIPDALSIAGKASAAPLSANRGTES